MSAHPVDVHVGKKLRLQRTIMGFSQEALAKAVGITFQQVQKYERGINRMSASRLFDFAKVMNVEVSYFYEGFNESGESGNLLEGVSEQSSETFSYEDVASRETLELIRSYHRIRNPQLKRRVADLVRALTDDKELEESDIVP